jgi:hypothetical protein
MRRAAAASLRAKTKRNSGHDMRTIIKRVNRTTRGWGNYFRGGVRNVPVRLDQWIRMRLRSILRKRDKRLGPAEEILPEIARLAGGRPAWTAENFKIR